MGRPKLSPLVIACAAASGLIFIFIFWAYVSGKLADFLLGEEYYVLGNAAVYPHIEAWWRYFLANGRLVEGIYWTYLYEVFGFAPAIFRIFSYLLLYIGALLAAVAVSRVWPKRQIRPLIAFVLTILFFFAPHALNWANKLSGDNSRIAIIFFWGSVLFFQQWMAEGFARRRLFWSAICLYLLSLFTYENATLLFPVAILLSVPLLPKRQLTRDTYIKLAILSFAGLFLVIFPIATYSFVSNLPDANVSHYAISGGSDLWSRLTAFFPNLMRFLVTSADTEVAQRGAWGLLYFFAVPVSVGTILFVGRNKLSRRERNSYLQLIIAAAWLVLGGLAIYALLGVGIEAPTRAYVLAMMGFPILLALLWWAVKDWWRVLAVVLMAVWVSMAWVEFQGRTEYYARQEPIYNKYLLSIYELVPEVKPDTWFVLVDFEIGGWGCGPSLMMLYQQQDLFCARLSTEDPGYIADRYPSDLLNVRNTGGWIRNGNIIILGVDSRGEMFIMPEITQETAVFVNWISTEPIKTDFRRIVDDDSNELSPMAAHLYKRQELLLSNQN